MTTAFSSSPSPRANWLLRYLDIQQRSDKLVTAALHDALDAVERALKALEGKPGISAAVRRTQLISSRGSITKVMKLLYEHIGDVVREGQADAAGAATEAQLYEENKIFSIIENDPQKRQVLRRNLEDSARRNIQSTMTRVLKTERPLSRRLYSSQANTMQMVSRTINRHLAMGSSAEDMAKELRQFFNPDVPGGATYAARRLSRTEINNAFHAQSIADMEDRPWVNTVRWNLSRSHTKRDLCNTYAELAYFPTNGVPEKPHPNCFCFLTPEMPSFEEARKDFLMGRYDAWLDEHL